MKVLSLEFEDKSSGWKLEKTTFDSVTLLIGASGVGKTRILRAIQALVCIAEGDSLAAEEPPKSFSWRLKFSSVQGNQFIWAGEVKNDHETSKFILEQIYENDQLILDKELGKTIFRGKNISVKLAETKSVLNLLTGEDVIAKIKSNLDSIRFRDLSGSTAIDDVEFVADNLLNFTYQKLISSPTLGIRNKLLWLSTTGHSKLSQIEEGFRDLLPFVDRCSVTETEHEAFGNRYVRITIDEKGISGEKNWLPTDASHMIQTYLKIAELHLSPTGTVFLIDDFENHHGVKLTNQIMTLDRNCQFIISSHHPYIINNIGFKHWRIVTRNGGTVSTHNASHFNLSQSKHKAFTQLINLDAYIEGVVA